MIFRAIGLMSGTSMDGIDVALIETDGETVAAMGPSASYAYAAADRDLLRQALADAAGMTDRAVRPGVLGEAELLVTRRHAEAVQRFLKDNQLSPSAIDVVGFHGQTVWHRPEQKLTVQIGDGQALADATGLRVVYDLRAADVAAGGQGAPLVPVYHRALARSLGEGGSIAVLNIGGVANITFIDRETLIACDTGPGNALIDDLVLARTGGRYDADGALAARGRVDETALTRLLAHPYFEQSPPKSLDRNDFRAHVAAHGGLDAMSAEDAAATLTALTSATIARVVERLPRAPATWIVAGGGALNPTLMRMLSTRVAPARVETAADVGWSVEAMEAQAFAFLAVRALSGIPLTFPGTTGVAAALTGGVVVTPRAKAKTA
ncbi:anhydro-N-acetylmuramic acid kinase [Variibacter gotjawalensis]|uniref:Anhydro-N-acetylmuramic acid kinase n=1 Tax=Variibacter gotjawalensis TaxID=1333996 RepID=A0A0S3PY93_9BRAD|nr:anhydro-N-acetylmuramic acid kinase [Variibacter gotjawalensis]NIK46687.1 anhydro-N-acetylmuramic acid kinase [Variibacter gotjawalensis]RZS48590.1 anhydro-N-acetylmuramic acid kinase [Variibacter gotjawalensis]BAT60852.1 anhydro-N-acetylmuramic acid kinase [Variibacter gotjawalensis]